MSNSIKPPIWFWIVSILAFVWNGMGVKAYLDQAYNTESFQSATTVEQMAALAETPSWAIGAFATAVFAGLLGCLLLLLRKRLAYIFFVISFLAVVVQNIYFLMHPVSGANYGMTAAIIVVAIFLVWFSKHSRHRGWLR